MTPDRTIHQHKWTPGAKNTHGNPTGGWADPEPVAVFGWHPGEGTEQVDGRSTVTERLTLLIPPGFECDHRDRFTVDGLLFEVDGPARWYTGGPFGYAPGGELRLVRVTGG